MANCGSLLGRTGAALVALVLCAVPATSHGQGSYAGLVGIVRDSAGHPIRDVQVRLTRPSNPRALTNESGGFAFSSLAPGETFVVIRRLGFAPDSTHIILRPGRIDSLVMMMAAMVAELPGVTVEDEMDARSHRILAEFWERRSRGFGTFMTRDEIEKRGARDFVDLTRMIPSLRVITMNGRRTLRFNGTLQPRDCPPQYVVDGMRIESGSPDEFTPSDIEALEFYSGPATIPPQFTNRAFSHTCGVIVIWTRLPG
jgi:carboxypeptidase family protein/TonB-dependent receptor-like protein